MNIANNTALKKLECHSNPILTTLTCNDAFDFTTTHISINKGLDIISASGSVLTPSVGDLITVNLGTGIVFSASNGSFKIVSVAETRLAWSTEQINTNVRNEDDGMANMNTIKAINPDLSRYPAFKWCADYGTSWYLPALNELKVIYENKSIISRTLSEFGYSDLLSNDDYASSCEDGYYRNVEANFHRTSWSTSSQPKYDEDFIRAILAF